MYYVRRKPVFITPHAYDGMNAERAYIKVEQVLETLIEPDKIIKEFGVRHKTMKWLGNRTVIIYYDEYEDEIDVVGVSTTRRKIT